MLVLLGNGVVSSLHTAIICIPSITLNLGEALHGSLSHRYKQLVGALGLWDTGSGGALKSMDTSCRNLKHFHE